MTDIHSCSLYCDRPECIKAQRDELRDKMAQPEQEVSIEVLRAITNAGLTLLKKQHGYELRKLGPVIAHNIKENT